MAMPEKCYFAQVEEAREAKRAAVQKGSKGARMAKNPESISLNTTELSKNATSVQGLAANSEGNTENCISKHVRCTQHRGRTSNTSCKNEIRPVGEPNFEFDVSRQQ